jgi:CheY-like chemotaxis protein
VRINVLSQIAAAPRRADYARTDRSRSGFWVMSGHAESAQKPLILVVDDEALIRMLASEVLQDAGYTVIEAGTAVEALEVLDRGIDIQAVFTDVNMPGSPDGLGLAQRVREMSPTCAIVVASGRYKPTSEELAPGALFMSKPYSVDAIVSAFDELLGT